MLRISTSITDFAPLFFDLEYLFRGLCETGVDGVELVIGIKSRFRSSKLRELSRKYHLPITSIHQPAWGGLGLYFDEDFIDFAKAVGTNKIVFHPLPKVSLTDKRMRSYFRRLAQIQEKKKIEVFLENLPNSYGLKLLSTFFPLNDSGSDIQQLSKVVDEFGFKLNLDIDHLRLRAPQKESWFQKLLPKVGNIHLSSFAKDKNHLPLYLGDFQTKPFMQALEKNQYKGLLTFEIYYPHLIQPFSYNFDAIKRSLAILRS